MANLVVKTNYLNTVLQNLSLIEIRIIQLAIIDARENQKGLSVNEPLRINAERYAQAFDTTKDNAYKVLSEASITLLRRYFSFINPRNNVVSSNWVSQIEYCEKAGAIELIFTPAVINGISRIDGAVEFFTKYLLSNTINFKSVYSVRLYELIVQWKNAQKTPVFEIEIFRKQLGIESNQYKAMKDFKLRVLDKAVSEINEHSDLKINYEQHKKGRVIYGFSFIIKPKRKKKSSINEAKDNTIDMFTNMTDKQRNYFASKLSELPELSKFAEAGADYQQFAKKIADELKTSDGIEKYKDSLIKLGFNKSCGILHL